MNRCLQLFFCLLAFNLLDANAQSELSIPKDIQTEFSEFGEIYFSFSIEDHSKIKHLSRIVSIDNVKGNVVFAYANKKEFVNFLQEKYDYQILPHPGFLQEPEMKNNFDLNQPLTWNYYPTYTAYEALMAQFQANYPGICHLDTLTTLSSGRRLLVLKISDNISTRENEPQFLYTSTMHGDETTGYICMLHLIDYLLTNYGTNSKVTNLINNVEIWICPNTNPDGTYHGGNSTVGGATRYNNNNIDLNRNFPDPQDGQHPDGNAWQPETIAFMNFAESNNFVLSINFHGGSEVVNYPWDTWYQLHADDTWFQFISHQYADTVHANAPATYMSGFDNGITNGYEWYTLTGGRQDFMTYFHHGRESTIEISNIKSPPASELLNYWNYNYKSFLNYIEQSLYGIRGVITDSISGQPIVAKVFISGHDTDSTHVWSDMPIGDYHRLIAAGTYNVTYSANGYITKTISGITVSNLSTQTVNVQLVPISTAASLTGTLTYDNLTQTPIPNVTVSLRNSNNLLIVSTLTNSSGYFQLDGIPAGNYHFDLQTTNVPGGINSADALQILKHFVGISQLTGLKQTAADVDNNSYINSIDALMTQKRFVGLINSFPAGNWLFTNDSINISSGTTIHNLRGLCYGDVNASFLTSP